MGDLGVGKIFVIALVFMIICGICFFAIADGIVEIIKEFFQNLAEKVLEALENLWDKVKQLFGYSTVKNGMIITAIEKNNVENLREQIEATGVDTEQAGITEILLRKMLLAQAVTSSTQDTLCVAEIEQTDILKGTGYSNLQSYLDTLDEENSKDVWPIEDYDYDLYYLTDQFFYFKDEDDMMGKGEDKYFIAVMGSIIMKTESGGDFVYVSEEEFEVAKQEYIDGVISQSELLKYYTVDASGQMQVYKIVENTIQVDYKFKIDDTATIDETYFDGNSTYNITRVPVNIETNVDSSTYVLSIELLMHMLDISASPEYLEYFIDYALEQTKITVKGYKIENTDRTYERKRYNIEDDFIFELYDIVNIADIGSDNMIAYKDIIFKRWYDMETFTCSVVDLPDFEKIDHGTPTVDEFMKKYNDYMTTYLGITEQTKEEFRQMIIDAYPENEEPDRKFTRAEAVGTYVGWIYALDGFSEEEINNKIGIIYQYVKTGKETTVEPLHTYLAAAYDPGAGFSLGEIAVGQGTVTTKKDISLIFTMENISTWYGDIKFNKPKKTTEYYIDAVECEETEYNEFGYDDLINWTSEADQEKTTIYICTDRATEAGISIGGNIIGINSDDIYDNVLVLNTSVNKETNFAVLTLRGLGKISFEDKGTYNDKTGVFQGSDYLYTKYKKTNVQKYDPMTKYKNEVLHISTNIPRVSLSRVNMFLGQWQNKDGKKTKDPATDDLLFDSEGIKVEYDDIYLGTSVVGDMFESGAYMVFELLESSESTKKLVNVFKYIMYVYTGTDYGVTEESMLGFIFGTVPYGGADYIVNTEMCPSKYVLNKEQLEQAITNVDLSSFLGKNQAQAKANLKACIDDFIYIQDTYKVNAVFAMAVTMQESGCGTAWAAIDSSWHNWASMAYWTGTSGGCSPKSGLHQWCTYSSFNQAARDFGNYIANYGDEYCGYYQQGRYSVLEITELYAGPSEQAWGPLVVAKMTDMYESIGIQGATGGALQGISEDGCETITFGDRTYVEYKQGKAEYANIPLAAYEHQFPNTNLKSSGCAITSDAIIATGFGVNATPISVNNMGSNNHDWILTQLTGRSWSCIEPFSKSGVIQQLKQGYPTMVMVVPGHPRFSTSSTHYFTILSISEDGNSVYVSDPGSSSITRNGWLPISVLNSSSFDLYRRVY